MTTPDKATEAGLGPTAQRPKALAGPAQDVTLHEVDHVEVLAQDSKAAKILAKAEAARIEAAASEAAKDREAARRQRAEADRLEAHAIKAARRQAKADNRAARVAQGRQKAMAKAANALASIRAEAAASYAGFIYLITISVAVGSQFVFFKRLIDGNESLSTLQAVSGFAAVLAALFIEGFGLAFYATSVASRLRGRGGWVPRIAAWAVTAFAAKMQYEAHRDLLVLGKPLVSWACAFASLGAMLLAEVRTTYKVGETLEALDQKDKPQARLGVKFALRYPRQFWWAFSAQIANPEIRTRTAALQAGQELAQLRDQADMNKALMREATRALHAAQKKDGTSEAILFRLTELAHLGHAALEAQAQLASAQMVTEAAAQGSAQEAEAEQPKAAKAAAQVGRPNQRPTAQASAQVARKAQAPAIEPKAPFEAWAAEAWADRPNGPDVWAERVAELASIYPLGNELPSRAELIESMKLRAIDPSLAPLRFTWTNKGYVGWAMADLKALRAEGYADPVLPAQKTDIKS
jgi:hypothetical protein